MNELPKLLPTRPAADLAFLARTQMGEIVVKRGGKLLSRRLFVQLQTCPCCTLPYDGEHCSVCLDGAW